MFHRTSDIKFKETWIRIGNQRTRECMLEITRLPAWSLQSLMPASIDRIFLVESSFKIKIVWLFKYAYEFWISIKHWLTCNCVISFKCTARISEWFNKRPIEWNFSHTSRCLLIFLAFIMKSNQIYVSGQVHNALHHFYKLLCWAATFIETTNEHKG